MSKFYTDISIHKNRIVETGYHNGEKFIKKHKYQPTLGIETEQETEWKTMKGNKNLQVKTFEDIRSFRNYTKEYGDTIPLHGNISPEYQFIYDHYRDMKPDISQIKVLEFDIEAVSEEGFPKPEEAKWPINSITIKDRNTQLFYVVSTKPYDKEQAIDIDPKQIKFKYCKSEEHLIRVFIGIMQNLKPDILIGYYSNGFDFPYLINRAFAILPEEQVRKMSPLGEVSCIPRDYKGKTEFKCKIKGVTLLDFLDLYKKYIFTPRESYSLDFISEAELGKNKIKYEEFDNLVELWKEDPQKFVSYNIIDVELIDLLDQKLGLIDILINVTYEAKCNFIDALGTVVMWDVIFYNDLRNRNIMCPPMHHNKKEKYAGGYVKEPKKQLYKWLFTGDLNSEYPHCQMQWNISPECIVENREREDVNWEEIDEKLLNQEIDVDQNYILAGNGHYFRNDIEGFVPKILKRIYNERVLAKKEMLRLKQEYETTKDESLLPKIAQLHNVQMTKKIIINSEYGCLGTTHSRYYDARMASAVTLSGQWAIKWVAKYLMEHKLQKKYKWEHVYSDTDSIACNCEYVVKQIKKKYPGIDDQKITDKLDIFFEKIIQPIIDEGYEKLKVYCNANENKMKMKREKFISSACWLAKKKYACMVIDNEGVRYTKPKLTVSGIEIVRSSTPAVCREHLKTAVELVLTDESKLQTYIDEFKKQFKTYTPEQIAFPRGCNNLEKNSDPNTIYIKGTPIHVRAALLYNKFIVDSGLESKFNLIDEGSKIKFLYMKTPNPIQNENVFGFIKKWPSSELTKYIDYETQYYKSFESIIEGICEKVGIKINQKDVDMSNLF